MSEKKLEIFVRILSGERISKLKTWEEAVAFLVFRVESTDEPRETSDPVVLVGFVNEVLVLFELMMRLDLNARIERFDHEGSSVCWRIAHGRINALRSSAHDICALVLKTDFEHLLKCHLQASGLTMYD